MKFSYYLLSKKENKKEQKKHIMFSKKFTLNTCLKKENSMINDYEPQTTEIHNKNVNVVVINNILTEPSNNKKSLDFK